MLASGLCPPASVGTLARPPPFPPDPPASSPLLPLPSPSASLFSPPSSTTAIPLRNNLPESGAPSLRLPGQIGVSAADLLASFLITPKSSLQIPNLVTVPNPSWNPNLNLQPSPPLTLEAQPPVSFLTPILPTPPHIPLPTPSIPIPDPNLPPKQPTWADKAKHSTDKTLKRMSSTPPTITAEGIPRVEIPDEVFERGALQHRDFIVGRFFGRIPAFKIIQNVLNYLWGKGNKLEVHMIQSTRSMIVRIPSDFIREKVLKKRIWYVDTAMFHVAQWSDGEVADTSSLETIPIWAHLIGVPFDLMTNEGLGWIADALGDPKEMDDWTKNLSSLSVAHVKVEADATKPFPTMLELVRKSGTTFRVKVEYPWLPPTCSHCKELGHILKDCLKIKRQWVPKNKVTDDMEVSSSSDGVVVTIHEPSPVDVSHPAESEPDPALPIPPSSDPAVAPSPPSPAPVVALSPVSAEMDIDAIPILAPPLPIPIIPPENLPSCPPPPLPTYNPPSPPPSSNPPSSPLSPASENIISPPLQNYVLALAATVMPQSSIKPPSSLGIKNFFSPITEPTPVTGADHFLQSPYIISDDVAAFPPLTASKWESLKRKSRQFSKTPLPVKSSYLNPFAPLSISSLSDPRSLPVHTLPPSHKNPAPPPPSPPLPPPTSEPSSSSSTPSTPFVSSHDVGTLLPRGVSPHNH